tara:strand:- start:713 stop:1111 length:399 start_codon:yes stop_codon:yes gene_type:complete
MHNVKSVRRLLAKAHSVGDTREMCRITKKHGALLTQYAKSCKANVYRKNQIRLKNVKMQVHSHSDGEMHRLDRKGSGGQDMLRYIDPKGPRDWNTMKGGKVVRKGESPKCDHGRVQFVRNVDNYGNASIACK